MYQQVGDAGWPCHVKPIFTGLGLLLFKYPQPYGLWALVCHDFLE